MSESVIVSSEGAATEPWIVVEIGSKRAAAVPDWPAFRSSLESEIQRRGGALVSRDEMPADARHAVVIGCDDGDAAVHFAAGSSAVHALVLMRCDLSSKSVELLSEDERTAVLTVADASDRSRLAAAVDGHLASRHEASDIEIAPFDAARLAPVIAEWIADRVSEDIWVEEVTISTPDGWRLGADLFLPADAVSAPAVVLMHTGRSDREVFDRLASLLAARGVAALALDWRGRGASTNLGRFVDFTSEQQNAVAGDVVAAYDYLATRSEIDGDWFAVLGIAHGAGYGANGALGDERTRAVALMTAYHLLVPEQVEVLQSGEVAVLCVAGTSNKMSSGALREIYKTSTNPNSRLMEFREGVLGYQLFDLHTDLEPAIADWFAEVLDA